MNQIDFHNFRSVTGRLMGVTFAATLGVALLGCDQQPSEPADALDPDRDADLIMEIATGPMEIDETVAAELIATVELPGGGEVTFVDGGDDAVVMVIDATAESAPVMDFLMQEYEPTPLEIFRHFTPAGREAPQKLVLNHSGEVAARGLGAEEPRELVVPRVVFSNTDLENPYTRCDVAGLWDYDWEQSFDHRDVYASAFYSELQFYPGTWYNFYSGAEDVQRVNWGVCVAHHWIDWNDYVKFAFYKSNNAFNWECGGSDWTLVSIPDPVIQVNEDTARVVYYYAGTTPDKTCIRVWASYWGVGDLMTRDVGVGVAYDEPLGVG